MKKWSVLRKVQKPGRFSDCLHHQKHIEYEIQEVESHGVKSQQENKVLIVPKVKHER